MAGCATASGRSGTPEAAYTVEDRLSVPGDDGTRHVEVRRYGDRVAAEVIPRDGGAPTTGNAAFRLLFDYIAGANRQGETVAMTTPVAKPAGGRRSREKIPMTVPVESTGTDRAGTTGEAPYVMRFFLPEGYTVETAPVPTHARVRIVGLPGRDMAVLRFSGFRNDDRTEARKADLLAALERTPWHPVGQPVAWFYDPPWTLPFLRRNEVAVAVEQR